MQGIDMKNKICTLAIFFSIFMIGCNNASEEMVINTPTIQCGMCQKAIEMGLGKLQGVARSKVDLASKTALVAYHAEKTNVPAIEKRISELGYQANEVAADSESYEALPACCKIGGMDKM